MIERDKAFAILAEQISDEIVVTGVGSQTASWLAARPRPLNLYLRGPMGLAPAVGLGVALAHPDRKVVVIEGDGGLRPDRAGTGYRVGDLGRRRRYAEENHKEIPGRRCVRLPAYSHRHQHREAVAGDVSARRDQVSISGGLEGKIHLTEKAAFTILSPCKNRSYDGRFPSLQPKEALINVITLIA